MNDHTPRNNDDLLQQFKKNWRRLGYTEIVAAGMKELEAVGMDLHELEHAATMSGLDVEDIAFLIGSHRPIQILPTINTPLGKPGRKPSNYDIACFAQERKMRVAVKEKVTWKDILHEWKQEKPNDLRVKNAETIREAWRRYFGDKRD